ncbi:MAG: hypothetical protein Kow0069_14590 [Promethearchaeota archaeon]
MAPRKLVTMREIEGLRGIRGPHEEELSDLAADAVVTFRQVPRDAARLSHWVAEVGARLEPLERGEEWALAKEMFPGVVVHVAYQYYGDEFGPGEEDAVEVLFSGERAGWVPGEDLASFVEVLLGALRRAAPGAPENPPELASTWDGVPSPMLARALAERAEPFRLLDSGHWDALARFLGGRRLPGDPPVVRWSPLPKISLRFWVEPEGGVGHGIDGPRVERHPRYDVERLLVLGVNHALRFVKVTLAGEGVDLPAIVEQMFSGSYKSAHPDQFERAPLGP